jgi:two-component system, cell cycle response regulator
MNTSDIGHIKVLLVEDNPGDTRLIEEMLECGTGKFECDTSSRLSVGMERLKGGTYDVLLLDLGLPDSSGITTLKSVLNSELGVPVVVLTGHTDENIGIEAVKEGAQDYLVKGRVDSDLLVRSIRYAIERQGLLAELHALSLRDYLTGLNNRRGFFTLSEQHAKLAKRNKKDLLIVVIDVNDFKKINDAFGHETGDTALAETARILRETFRDSDIIGRIGGDEFAICIIEDDKFNSEILNDRLQEILKEHNDRKERPYILSLSAGIARCSCESSHSLEALVSEADNLMYEQKKKYYLSRDSQSK